MKHLLKKVFPKKEDPDFLVVDIGLQTLAGAVFKPQTSGVPKMMGLGRKGSTSIDNLPDVLPEVLKTVEAITTKLPPKVLLGVSGVGTKTATVVAKVTRPDANKVIGDDELQEVLVRSAQSQPPFNDSEKEDYKLFFSAVVWANIDGAKTANPLGSKGAAMEVSCFHAYKKVRELENWDKIFVDSGFEIRKVVPTAFALSKIIIRNGIQSLILIRISENVTEVSFIAETNIAEIATFDIGFGDLEIWSKAISILFAEVSLPKGLPDVIWVYPEGKEEVGERVRTSLLEIPWKSDFKREIPNVKLGQKPEGFSLMDTPLISLGMEGLN